MSAPPSTARHRPQSVKRTERCPRVARNAEAQGERLAGGGAAVALLARKFAHSGIEQPGALRAGPLAVAGVGGREIAVSQAFLENRFGHLAVQGPAFGLLVLFVPAEPQPLEALENRVDRGIGVALDVGIVEPQDHGSAVAAGV